MTIALVNIMHEHEAFLFPVSGAAVVGCRRAGAGGQELAAGGQEAGGQGAGGRGAGVGGRGAGWGVKGARGTERHISAGDRC